MEHMNRRLENRHKRRPNKARHTKKAKPQAEALRKFDETWARFQKGLGLSPFPWIGPFALADLFTPGLFRFNLSPMPVWYCQPCGVDLSIEFGSVEGDLFCPKCKRVMTLHSKRQAQSPDGSIEVTFERMPISKLAAPPLQIEAPKKGKK
jgi:hypothetical protein